MRGLGRPRKPEESVVESVSEGKGVLWRCYAFKKSKIFRIKYP